MVNVDLNLLYALLFTLALIVTDVVLGVAISLRDDTFDLNKLPQFLKTQVLPYYMSLTVLALLAQIKDIQNLGTSVVAWGAIVAYVAKVIWVDIGGKIKVLFGFDVPEIEQKND